MARILMGWELGANRGHIVRLLHYHDALVAAGHQVSMALQRIDGLAVEGMRIPGTVLQAPVWPRLLGTVGHIDSAAPNTMADILARLGLGDPGMFGALLAGWDALLAAEKPDAVVADYAPALLCAARGRVPTIAIGNGFDVPPATMARFPTLGDGEPLFDEAPLLAAINREFAAAGRPAIAALPQMFATDHQLASVLGDLDPYAPWRTDPVAAPTVELPLPPVTDGTGDELFVYWPEHTQATPGLWEGIRRAGMPVRMYLPRIGEAAIDRLEALGFAIERQSMRFGRIGARARMVLSHGGAGFVTMAMLVGLPQMVIPFDLEKRMQGKAVERLGIGARMGLLNIDPEAMAQALRRLWEDAALGPRARAVALDQRARMGPSAGDEAAAAVARLAG